MQTIEITALAGWIVAALLLFVILLYRRAMKGKVNVLEGAVKLANDLLYAKQGQRKLRVFKWTFIGAWLLSAYGLVQGAVDVTNFVMMLASIIGIPAAIFALGNSWEHREERLEKTGTGNGGGA